MKWKRWCSAGFITAYLGWLSFGIVGHALNLEATSNTSGYYVVWDMFCGWTAYDTRVHLVARGESGQYYEVTAAPWGSLTPFGDLPRVQYDSTWTYLPKYVANVLRHTAHEPIDRVYVVEENWPKQYNMPPRLWADYHVGEPADKVSYFNVRNICSEDGVVLATYPDWLTQLTMQSINDNPRLRAVASGSTPYYDTVVNPSSKNQKSTWNQNLPNLTN
ncbi:MAG: hypothetical protein KDA96_06520 [Planctomycetaceae bacterium]|nr:hypothetical protein [Planctomycetaceae bacterium]